MTTAACVCAAGVRSARQQAEAACDGGRTSESPGHGGRTCDGGRTSESPGRRIAGGARLQRGRRHAAGAARQRSAHFRFDVGQCPLVTLALRLSDHTA